MAFRKWVIRCVHGHTIRSFFVPLVKPLQRIYVSKLTYYYEIYICSKASISFICDCISPSLLAFGDPQSSASWRLKYSSFRALNTGSIIDSIAIPIESHLYLWNSKRMNIEFDILMEGMITLLDYLLIQELDVIVPLRALKKGVICIALSSSKTIFSIRSIQL